MASTGSSSNVVTTEAAPAQAAIVVGLVSYNNGATAGAVAEALRQGLVSHFPDTTARFVLADCGSTDDTPAHVRDRLRQTGEVVELAVAPAAAEVLEHPYHRIPGKARAVHGILTAARDLGARACVVLDAGIETVTPQWLQWLSGPVLEHGFDLVAPFYRRHPFEGAIQKGIVYPMFRALYGVRLRQPAAGEFVCSSRLLERFLDDDVWDREGAQIGIDLWLTSTAVSGDFRIGEAALGVRRQITRGDEPLDLGTTVTQVVGALFADLEYHVDRWQRVRGSVPVQPFGELSIRAAHPPVSIDHEKLTESFRLGYRELRDIWSRVLPPRTILDLRRLVDGPPAGFRLGDELWARIIYDFALAYRLRLLPREHSLRSLVPLYLAWLASFVLEVRDRSDDEVEQRLERLGAAFETQKPYLISKWRWPERQRS
jgi:hypothetical protein